MNINTRTHIDTISNNICKLSDAIRTAKLNKQYQTEARLKILQENVSLIIDNATSNKPRTDAKVLSKFISNQINKGLSKNQTMVEG